MFGHCTRRPALGLSNLWVMNDSMPSRYSANIIVETSKNKKCDPMSRSLGYTHLQYELIVNLHNGSSPLLTNLFKI